MPIRPITPISPLRVMGVTSVVENIRNIRQRNFLIQNMLISPLVFYFLTTSESLLPCRKELVLITNISSGLKMRYDNVPI